MRSLASWRPSVLARHTDVAPGLVQEDEPPGIERLGEREKPAPKLLNPRLRLLRRAQGLFFRVSPSFFSVRPIAAGLTLRPVRR